MPRLFPQKERNMKPQQDTLQALLAAKCRIGFRYKFEHYRNGELIGEEIVDNIIPDEGITYLLNAGLNAGSQLSSWFVGIYEGNYTPVAEDTAATFPGSSTEITTAYSEATRVALVPDDIEEGLWSNAGTPAEFTFTAPKTVRGGFISSSGTKGGVTGVLLSAVKAGTARDVIVGDVLKVSTGIVLTST
jgi:hypothetical protein